MGFNHEKLFTKKSGLSPAEHGDIVDVFSITAGQASDQRDLMVEREKTAWRKFGDLVRVATQEISGSLRWGAHPEIHQLSSGVGVTVP